MSTLFIKYSAIRKEQWPSLPATNKCMYKTVIQVYLLQNNDRIMENMEL